MNVFGYDRELDDTARLVLMGSPRCTLMEFASVLREHCGAQLGLVEIGDLWRKYRGFDGRLMPTHDVVSGARIVVGHPRVDVPE